MLHELLRKGRDAIDQPGGEGFPARESRSVSVISSAGNLAACANGCVGFGHTAGARPRRLSVAQSRSAAVPDLGFCL